MTQTLFVLLGVGQAAVAATDVIRTWMIFAVVAATGVVAALDGPARQVYDPALRGRVMAVWLRALPGTMPFTSFLAGLVAQLVGARAGFGLAGAALLVTVFLAWRALDE